MNKVDYFINELGYIRNPDIKIFAMKAINSLPEYFFHVSASSTNKYHPNYALGEGGLVRHVRAAVRIAVELFRLEMYQIYSPEEKDLMIVALLLHDGYKSGKVQEKYTITTHPLIAEEEIRDNPELQHIIPDEWMFYITEAIASHMGQWNTEYKTGKVVLPKPETKSQKFVHMCDYLASRKCLEVNFEAKYDD